MNISDASSAPVTSTREPTRSQQIRQQAQTQAVRERQAESAPPAEPPKPVVNSQGQTTGRLVNTTA